MTDKSEMRKHVWTALKNTGMVFLTMLFLMVCIAAINSDLVYANDSVTACEQEAVNYRNVVISPGNDSDWDSLKISASMKYGEDTVQQFTKELDRNSAQEGASEVYRIELPYFGEWFLNIAYMKDGAELDSEEVTVGVVADEYNIAPLYGSVPALIFSLKSLGGGIPSQTADGDPIPSIVTLSRPSQFDWNNLPANMYENPYVSLQNGAYGSSEINLEAAAPRMKAYVESLIRYNSDSKFNFYFSDYHFYQVMPSLVYETGLSEDRYKLVFITDGGGVSYNTFREAYDNTSDAESKHNQLKNEYIGNEYIGLEERMRSGEQLDSSTKRKLYKYVYAIVDSTEDAEWWVIRKSSGDTFAIQDKNFLQTVIDDGRVSSNYINNLLAAVENAQKGQTLKNLYSFEDEAFESIRSEGKTPMMILGTSSTVEGADPIDEYVRIIRAYYGDAYGYVYKGHPGNIPSEARIREIEDQGMYYVDASIAAELFMFYNPDTQICGYPSTTFQYGDGESTSKALFLTDKKNAYHCEEKLWTVVKQYAASVDFFVSKVELKDGNYVLGSAAKRTSGSSDSSMLTKVSSIDLKAAAIMEDLGHSYYLLEFNPGKEKNLLIWDSNDGILIDPETYSDENGDGGNNGNNSEDPESGNNSGNQDGQNDQNNQGSQNNQDDQNNQNNQSNQSGGENAQAKISISKAVTSSITDRVYTGKVHKPVPKVTVNGKNLKAGSDFVISYSRNNAIGKAALTIRGTGRYEGKITRSFKIIPPSTKITKLKLSGKKLTLSWKKIKQASAYQIAVSSDKTFKKGTKKYLSKGSKKKITLKKGKTHYIRIRAYKKTASGTIYSKWSSVKRVKVK